jgi:hypothetical protein
MVHFKGEGETMALFNLKKKTVFIESEQLDYMMEYKSYVKGKSDQTKMKYKLLDGFQEVIGEKWYRFKDGTRQSFDMVAFLGTELGFIYAGSKYLANRHDISERTIFLRMKELVERGKVVKLHKRARKCNGRGKPIYLFVDHPYFQMWVDYLGLEDSNSDNGHTNFKTETVEIPCQTSIEQPNHVPTYAIHSKQERNIIYSNQEFLENPNYNNIVQYVINRVQDSIKKGTRIKYLSSYIDRIVRSLENQAIHHENMRQMKARKKNHEEIRQQLIELGLIPASRPVPFYNWLDERAEQPVKNKKAELDELGVY